MPLYDYKCIICGNIQSIIHTISDAMMGNAAQMYCPICNDEKIHERLIGTTSFRLSWRTTPHPGKRTPVKMIGKQMYDEDSYAVAKSKGRFKPVHSSKDPAAKKGYNTRIV